MNKFSRFAVIWATLSRMGRHCNEQVISWNAYMARLKRYNDIKTTERKHDAIITSLWHQNYVALMSQRGCYCVGCPLGILWQIPLGNYADISIHCPIIFCVCWKNITMESIGSIFDILVIHTFNCNFTTLQKQGATTVFDKNIYIYINNSNWS